MTTLTRWLSTLRALWAALPSLLFVQGKFLHTRDEPEMVELAKRKNMGGGTVYFVVGGYGGFQLQWTPFTKRLVLGWVGFAYIHCDIEQMIGYAGKSLVQEQRERERIQQRHDHLRRTILYAAKGYRDAAATLSQGDPRVGIYTGRAAALEQVLNDFNATPTTGA